MKYIFLFFILNLICFGALAVLSEKLPLFAPEQLEYLRTNYGVNNNEEFLKFFDEMKQDGLILEVVNRQSLEILGAVSFLNLFTLLATIHLLADKLFFKTIEQLPNIRNAVRRALFITIMISGFLILRLYNLMEWYLAAFVIALFLFIEYIIYRINLTKKAKQDEVQGFTQAE